MISILTKDLKETSPKNFVIKLFVDVVNHVSLSLSAIWFQMFNFFDGFGHLILEGRDDSLERMPVNALWNKIKDAI